MQRNPPATAAAQMRRNASIRSRDAVGVHEDLSLCLTELWSAMFPRRQDRPRSSDTEQMATLPDEAHPEVLRKATATVLNSRPPI